MTFYDRIKHGVDLTKFKADQAMRVRQVQGEIEELRREITVIREQIASATLQLHQEGVIANPELEEFCVKIDQVSEQIEAKDNLIAAIRIEEPPRIAQPTNQYTPVTPCPHCNFNVPVGAVFCTNCGNAIPSPAVPDPISSPAAARLCINCGSELDAGGSFCTQCGHNNSQDDAVSEEEDQ